MDDSVLGWWFAAEPRLPHGDGRAVVIGKTLRVEPPLVLCKHALHMSEHPADALRYAGGCLLYRVRGSGEILREAGNIGVSARTALAVRDATQMLLADARASALSVIDLWDAQPPAREFLETGRDELRAAAWNVAVASQEDIARDAPWDTAWDAARATADAAWAPTDATKAATDAARSASWAAGAAARAACNTSWAAGKAVIEAHRQRLLDAVIELFGGAASLAEIDAGRGEARCSD